MEIKLLVVDNFTARQIKDSANLADKQEFISLTKACDGAPYSQEYLSLRARQGKLKAIKQGRNWMTTKEWLKEYVINSSWEQKKIVFQGAEKASATIFNDIAESIGRGYERAVEIVRLKFKFPVFRFVPIKIPAYPPSWRLYYKKAIAGIFVFAVLISGSLLYFVPGVRAGFGNWAQTTARQFQKEIVYSGEDFIRGAEHLGEDISKLTKSAPQIPQRLVSWSKVFWQGSYKRGQIAGESIIKEESASQGSASDNFFTKRYDIVKNKFQLLPGFFKQSINKFSSLFGRTVFEFNEVPMNQVALELPSSQVSENVFDNSLAVLPLSPDSDQDNEIVETEKSLISTKLIETPLTQTTQTKAVEKVVEKLATQETIKVVEKIVEKEAPVVIQPAKWLDTVITGVLGVTDSINTPQLSVTGSFYGQTASLGNLTVRDDLTLVGGADVKGTVQIAGDLTVEGTARMNGDFYLKGVYVDDVNSTRVITNYIQGGSAGFSGAVGISTLGVGGDASFGSNSSDDFIVKSTADFQGPITGTLNLSNITSVKTPYQQTLRVAKRGGDYTTIANALSSISDNGTLTAYISTASGSGTLSQATVNSSAQSDTYKITFSSATEFSAVNSAGANQGSGQISLNFTTTDTYLTISSSSWGGTWVASDTLEIAVRPKAYLVEVYPGAYPESITMKSYVDIIGVEGQENTKIARYDADLVTGVSNAKLDGFTLELRGATAARSVINVGTTSPNLKNLAINGGSTAYVTGISVSTGSPRIEDVEITNALNGVSLTGIGTPAMGRVEIISTTNDVVVSGAGTLSSHNNQFKGGGKFIIENASAVIESTNDIYQGVTFTAAGTFRDLTHAKIYNCASGVAVGEFVYLSGNDNTIIEAQANGSSTMPSIGAVLKKPTNASCLVQTEGIYYDYALGTLLDLTPGLQYYISKETAGALTVTKPAGIGVVAQVIGLAQTTDELLIIPLSREGTTEGGTSPYSQTVNVAISGGDYTTLQAALNDITANSGSRYLMRVFPGTYTEIAGVVLESYVDIVCQGGPQATTIKRSTAGNIINADTNSVISTRLEGCTIDTDSADAGNTIINVGAGSPSLDNLVVQNTGAGASAIALSVNTGSPEISDITVSGVATGIKQTGIGGTVVKNSKITAVAGGTDIDIDAGTATFSYSRLLGPTNIDVASGATVYSIQNDLRGTAAMITGTGAVKTNYNNVITVAKAGGDYLTIQAAINGITDSTASNPYLVQVMPGVYQEQVIINNKSYIDLVAIGGTKVTKIAPAAGTAQAIVISGSSGNIIVRGFGIEVVE